MCGVGSHICSDVSSVYLSVPSLSGGGLREGNALSGSNIKYIKWERMGGGGGVGEVSPTSQHGSWWLHCVRIIVCHCVTLVTHNVVFRRKYPSLLSLPNTTNSPPKIKYTTFAKRSTTLPPQDKIQYKFTKPELGGGGGGGCPAQLLPARGYLRLKASLFKILAATLEHFLPPALDSGPQQRPAPPAQCALMTSILH